MNETEAQALYFSILWGVVYLCLMIWMSYIAVRLMTAYAGWPQLRLRKLIKHNIPMTIEHTALVARRLLSKNPRLILYLTGADSKQRCYMVECCRYATEIFDIQLVNSATLFSADDVAALALNPRLKLHFQLGGIHE